MTGKTWEEEKTVADWTLNIRHVNIRQESAGKGSCPPRSESPRPFGPTTITAIRVVARVKPYYIDYQQ